MGKRSDTIAISNESLLSLLKAEVVATRARSSVVEHYTDNVRVEGSIPSAPTNEKTGF